MQEEQNVCGMESTCFLLLLPICEDVFLKSLVGHLYKLLFYHLQVKLFSSKCFRIISVKIQISCAPSASLYYAFSSLSLFQEFCLLWFEYLLLERR